MLTELILLLDRSGSMASCLSDTEGGMNSFIRDQRGLVGDVNVTFILFDTANPCEIVHDRTPIANVGDLRLLPRGGTPLYEAICKTIDHVKERLKGATPKPDMVVFNIITDGEENQSRGFNKTDAKTRIEEQEKAGWHVIFLGANIDAMKEGASLGTQSGSTMNYAQNSVGTQSMWTATSSNLRNARKSMVTGQSRSAAEAYQLLNYTDEQREAAMGNATTDAKTTALFETISKTIEDEAKKS